MYLEKFKEKLENVHLKVNPNYKLFKLFNWLYKDLQDEFDKIYKKFVELKEYIDNKILELKTYIDNQVDILNKKISEIVVGTVPKLARNMKECYSEITTINADTEYTISIEYPERYNLATTIILGISAIKTSGVYTMYDITAIAQSYSVELASTNIILKFKTKTDLADLGYIQILLTITSLEDLT